MRYPENFGDGTSKNVVDDEDAQALRAEGLDPDLAVIAGIDLVQWELSLLLGFRR